MVVSVVVVLCAVLDVEDCVVEVELVVDVLVLVLLVPEHPARIPATVALESWRSRRRVVGREGDVSFTIGSCIFSKYINGLQIL